MIPSRCNAKHGFLFFWKVKYRTPASSNGAISGLCEVDQLVFPSAQRRHCNITFPTQHLNLQLYPATEVQMQLNCPGLSTSWSYAWVREESVCWRIFLFTWCQRGYMKTLPYLGMDRERRSVCGPLIQKKTKKKPTEFPVLFQCNRCLGSKQTSRLPIAHTATPGLLDTMLIFIHLFSFLRLQFSW